MARKTRNAQLDREITDAIVGYQARRHHQTIRECGTWAPDDPVPNLTEVKRREAAEVERCYLINVMERAKGSVSAGAEIAGLDRTNFRRLLQRHGLRERERERKP